jgi:hypothetical protein
MGITSSRRDCIGPQSLFFSLVDPSLPTGKDFLQDSSGLNRELRIYIRQHKIPESNKGCLSIVCNKEIKHEMQVALSIWHMLFYYKFEIPDLSFGRPYSS